MQLKRDVNAGLSIPISRFDLLCIASKHVSHVVLL